MLIEPINTQEFLETLKPALGASSADELAEFVRQRWTADQLCQLVISSSTDARRVACLLLGLVGDRQSVCCLARALRDDD